MHYIGPSKMRYLVKKQSLFIGSALLLLLQTTPSYAGEPDWTLVGTLAQSSKTNSQQDEINQLRQRVEMLEESEATEELHPQFGLNLGAYGDVNFVTKDRGEAHPAFVLGPLDLYSTVQIGPRLTFLSEMNFDFDQAPGEGDVEIERLWVGYTFNDLLTIRAGRQHTAIGFWNNTYHHGKLLFLTVDRPFFLAFEDDGGVLPVHIVGLEFSGSQNRPGFRWMYMLDVGNGHQINPDTKKLVPNVTADNNAAKQIALRLSLQPDRLPGLTLGVFGTVDRMGIQDIKNVDERVYGSDLSYIHDKMEFITEYFELANLEKHADAYYIQLGYKVIRDFTPYVRYESLNVNPNDPYFMELENNTDRNQKIAGVRFDIDELRSALKFQFRRDAKEGSKTFNVLEAQWAFSF
ncbi:MAG TPA: hypothetical protein VLY20_07400 [Nitrospiria bacterium]|nr:hypothetical protein [Nitrospiria bacterium]HUK56467.1 hypothetical protein [Nitrospiria bacterium]